MPKLLTVWTRSLHLSFVLFLMLTFKPNFYSLPSTSSSTIHINCEKILKRWGLTCLLRNQYVDQEATVRTLYGTTYWFRIEKGVRQGCLLSPCLFNLYTEHIIWNAGLDELLAGVKIAGETTSYADDTTIKAEVEEGLKTLFMRVKEESEKSGLKVNIKKQTNKQKLRSWHLVPSLYGK